MIVKNLTRLTKDEFRWFDEQLSRHDSLSSAIGWASSRSTGDCLPQIVGEVVAQDEYTNDVVIPFREYFIVYDTT